MNARILSSWAERDYRGYIDPEALQAIGEVVAIQLPYWVETTIVLDGDTRAREKVNLVWMGVGGQWVMQADRNALGILLAQIARDPQASARVMGQVEILEGKILGSVGIVPGLDYAEALDRIAGMRGMVDGGHLANDLSTAAMQDRIREWTISALGLGAGELVGKGGFPASLAVTMGENYVADNWATVYQDELEAHWAGSEDSDSTSRTDAVRSHIADLVNNSVPDEVIAASGMDRDQYIDQRMGEYKDKLERLDPVKVH